MDTVPIDPLLKGANGLVIAYPLFGTIIVALAFVIVMLWRDGKAKDKQREADMAAERSAHDAEIARIREKHDIEMAEQRRLNFELHNARYVELRATLTDVMKATGTLEQALIVIHGGIK